MKKIFIFLFLFSLMAEYALADEASVEYLNGAKIIEYPDGRVEILGEGMSPSDPDAIPNELLRKAEQASPQTTQKASQRQQEQTRSAKSNPVCDVDRNMARRDIQAELEDRYAPNYSTVESLLERNMEAYDKICTYSGTGKSGEVLRELKDRYYPNFGTINSLYERNMEAAGRLD